MRARLISAALVVAVVAGACGSDDGDDSEQRTERRGPSWELVEDLLADSSGWNAKFAHQVRLEAEAEGGTSQEGMRCWKGRLLPGEWPAGCDVYADFEREHGLVEKGEAELDEPSGGG